MNTPQTPCILCGDPYARTKEVDHGNRVFVDCAGVECGRYEISLRAVRLLGNDPSRARQVRSLVARHRSARQYVEIVVNTDGQLAATPMTEGAVP